MMARPVRILFYAINGTGLGHLSRLLNLARAARELLEVLRVPADFHFITTSEAPEVAWDFPVYKFPSKSIVRGAGADTSRFVQATKLTVINLVAHLAPDLLVLDTEPQGAFAELVFLRSYAKVTAFIDRHKDPRIAQSEVHRRHLPLYDRILVPDDPDQAHRYPAPPEITDKRRFIGRVHGFRPEHALEPEAARQQLGVPDGRRLVYLSAGGGGDTESQNSLHFLIEALLQIPDLHLAIGYGPLYRGERRRGPRITALAEPALHRYFPGFDAAISAAGYNTFFELLAAQVPTVFFAQDKGMDRQDERIAWGIERGLCAQFDASASQLSSLTVEHVHEKVQAILESPARVRIQEALEARAFDHGATVGAAELLGLIADQPGSSLKRQQILALGGWRLAWAPTPNASFRDDAQWALRWQKKALTVQQNNDDHERIADAFRARKPVNAFALTVGRVLSRWVVRGLSPETVERLLIAWAAHPNFQKMPTKDAQRLLDTLDVFEDTPEPAKLLTELLAGVAPKDGAERLYRLAAQLDHPEMSWPESIPSIPQDRRGFDAWLSTITGEDNQRETANQG